MVFVLVVFFRDGFFCCLVLVWFFSVVCFCWIFVCLFLLSGTGVSFSTWQDEIIYDSIHSPLHPCGHTEYSLRTATEFQLPM